MTNMTPAATTSPLIPPSRVSSKAHARAESQPWPVPVPVPVPVAASPTESLASPADPRSELALPHTDAYAFTWLLLDPAEASAPFLAALAPLTATTSPPSPASASASSTVLSPIQPKSTPGQLDKRLSLPFGGSIATSSTHKKTGLISRFRSGSNAVPSAPVAEKQESSIRHAVARVAFTHLLAPHKVQGFAQTATALLNRNALASPVPVPVEPPAAAAAAAAASSSTNDQSIPMGPLEPLDTAAIVRLASALHVDAVYVGPGLDPEPKPASALISALLVRHAKPRAVLVDPALTRTLTPTEARTLMSSAKAQNVWLALPTRWKSGSSFASKLLSDCAQTTHAHDCLTSDACSWDETLAVLESLEELRSTPQPFPSTTNGIDSTGQLPVIKDQAETSSSTGTSTSNEPALQIESKQVQNLLRQRDEQIALLEEQIRSNAGARSRSRSGSGHAPAEVASTPRRPSSPSARRKTGPVTDGNGNGNGNGNGSDGVRRVVSGTAGSGSGKVIHQLTAELESARASLEATRSKLRAAQKQVSVLQQQHDDVKESLGRTRLENESMNQMLGRKDRQAAESLERAHKAEAEAKELGRSSREWGTRVREVEAQLGSERILKARAEAQYEAIAQSWKATRDRMAAEVAELRKLVEGRAQELADEAARVVGIKQQMQDAWRERDQEKGQLGQVLQDLRTQHRQVEDMIGTSIGALVERLDAYERESRRQESEVDYVSGELSRILRLMRSGETTAPVT